VKFGRLVGPPVVGVAKKQYADTRSDHDAEITHRRDKPIRSQASPPPKLPARWQAHCWPQGYGRGGRGGTTRRRGGLSRSLRERHGNLLDKGCVQVSKQMVRQMKDDGPEADFCLAPGEFGGARDE